MPISNGKTIIISSDDEWNHEYPHGGAKVVITEYTAVLLPTRNGIPKFLLLFPGDNYPLMFDMKTKVAITVIGGIGIVSKKSSKIVPF
ncbi:hypothetical protein CL634_04820 [bacterium]|nr:hypothetical protein [bacterium]